MRKGFTPIEVLVVVVILAMIVLLLLPAIFAVRESVSPLMTYPYEEASVEEKFEQGDFAYLVLDGRKVQVISVQRQGVYLVRYANETGHLEQVSLSHFELTDDVELRQSLR